MLLARDPHGHPDAGDDGFGATAAIRERTRQGATRVPIIALTAPALSERCIAAGMDGYLSKPIVLKELEAMLDGIRPTRSTYTQGRADAAE